MISKYQGTADIYVTERCNENCIFCSAQKGGMDVSIDNFRIYVDNWIKYGVRHINITGGEPLLHPNIVELIDYAYYKGMDIALFTNGTLFNKVDFESILSKVQWLAISIDGNQKSNKDLGRLEVHFTLALNALKVFKRDFPNLKIRIATVVTKQNREQVIDLGHTLISQEIIPDLWRIKQVIPVRRASDNWDYLSIEDAEFDIFIKKVMDLFGKNITIKPNKWESKSGDLIVTYPSGNSGVTILSDGGNTAKVVHLGNIFSDFFSVIDNWYASINGNVLPSKNYKNEAWNK